MYLFIYLFIHLHDNQWHVVNSMYLVFLLMEVRELLLSGYDNFLYNMNNKIVVVKIWCYFNKINWNLINI